MIVLTRNIIPNTRKLKSVKMEIKLINDSITTLAVDAIVNAANTSLLGGGGVDGAIHKAAGKELLAECKTLGGCQTGDAKITKAYKLPAKYVIHTVGPVWRNGSNNEDELLESAYKRSLEVAAENNLETIAFPNISTGVYGFPKQRAAEIAIKTIKDFSKKNSSIKTVIFVVFDTENLEIYETLLKH